MISKKITSQLPPEFDYQMLLGQLVGFRYPRNKIGAMIRSGEINRIKKGVYTQGDSDYHPFVLANMIYGPSYVSEDSALSYYGLIPEHVHTTTSTTLGRKKRFETPAGFFTYERIPEAIYPIGQTRVEFASPRAFVIATPEKALFDRLWRIKGIDEKHTLREYLLENMRLDEGGQKIFRLARLNTLAKLCKRPFFAHAVEVIREMRAR